MPDTKEIRALRKKNHFSYDWWKYIAFSAMLCSLVYLMFSATAYKIPPQEKIDVYLVGPYALLVDDMKELEADILPVLSEDQQQVNFIALLYGANQIASSAGDVVQGYLGSRMGDIYIVPSDLFPTLAYRYAALPLDGYIDSGVLSADPDDYMPGSIKAEEDDDAHIYGVSATQLEGLYRYGYNAENTMIFVTSYSENADNAVRAMSWILDNLVQPRTVEGAESVKE